MAHEKNLCPKRKVDQLSMHNSKKARATQGQSQSTYVTSKEEDNPFQSHETTHEITSDSEVGAREITPTDDAEEDDQAEIGMSSSV
jgi:hypothetical protein